MVSQIALVAAVSLGLGPGANGLGLDLDLLKQLNTTLGGRVQQARPLAYPCFQDPNSDECAAVKNGLLNEFVRAGSYNGFMNMQGEACSSDFMDQCLLHPDSLATPANASCGQGLVSPYFVEITDAADVQAIFAYAQHPGAAELSIKNTGVDHNMRSSKKGTLAIWTHALQDQEFHSSFKPDNCDATDGDATAITLGTGVSVSDGLIFAHKYGHILAAANDGRPAIGGGWALNGGHGVLASAHGLGADNLLQAAVVTPDGEVRIANRCTNTDLFWALRGAGGGAFGVVLNVTMRAFTDAPVTMAQFSFEGSDDSMRGYTDLLARKLPEWALLGWGGASAANLSVLSNSLVDNTADAAAQLSAAVDYVEAQDGASVSFVTFPSFYDYWTTVVNGSLAAPEPISTAVLYTSRVVPVSITTDATTRKALVDAVLAISTTELTYGILANMPLLYGNITADPDTSLHPAWYEGALYLVAYAQWTSITSIADRKELIKTFREATELFNSVAPNGATYSNEADPWMEGWAEAFWGDTYAKLLEVKAKVDPKGLLNCWHCVGWDQSMENTCISGLVD